MSRQLDEGVLDTFGLNPDKSISNNCPFLQTYELTYWQGCSFSGSTVLVPARYNSANVGYFTLGYELYTPYETFNMYIDEIHLIATRIA